MQKIGKLPVILAAAIILVVGSVIAAEQQDTTVTFVIPSSLAVSLSYGNANSNTCDSSNFYFVEDDATIDGNQSDINVSDSSVGGSANYCQNATIDAVTVSNDGNDVVDINVLFTSALPTGVVVYVGDTYAATADGCVDTQDLSSSCINISTSAVRIFTSVAAATTKETFWKAKFTSADVGNGAGNEGSAARTLRINVTAT